MTKKTIRICIAQINCTVGDLEGNSRKVIDYLRKAKDLGSDIVSFPELAITGYPPEDLLLKDGFIRDNIDALNRVAKAVTDIVCVVGFADRDGGDIYNAAAVIHKGEVRSVYHKTLLPNYGVFDEKRYFKSGTQLPVFRFGEALFGVNICEDIWHKEGPLGMQAASGASLMININSSPYYAGKIKLRERVIRAQAKFNKVVISYANLIGGQDELVFDGQSMIVDETGKVLVRAAAFKEDIITADIELPELKAKAPQAVVVIADEAVAKPKPPAAKREVQPIDPAAEVYQALLLGLKDYAAKNGFKKAIVGLSGGIDSALVAALAADAMGKENVMGVFMPTKYSSAQSETDAKAVSANLGTRLATIPIDHIFKLYLMALEHQFAAMPKDVTEENLQARIRGNMLMALSNKFGYLVLTTGNKSEMSTGYATLYGDMAGGLAVIKDLFKTSVYKLAKYRNSLGKVIPDSVITKAPTAELRPDQKDIDTLPAYDLLDKILKAYIEEDKGFDEIAAMGFDKNIVARTLGMVDKSEYKRRQSPPGIKITPKAFGKDRRMPITNEYK